MISNTVQLFTRNTVISNALNYLQVNTIISNTVQLLTREHYDIKYGTIVY